MIKTMQYTSDGNILIEIPESFKSGTVTVNGYIVDELAGSNVIMLDREPSPGDNLVIKYETDSTKKPAEQRAIEDIILTNILKTIKVQQDTINRLQKALDDRPTYNHLNAVTKTLFSRMQLLEEMYSKE